MGDLYRQSDPACFVHAAAEWCVDRVAAPTHAFPLFADLFEGSAFEHEWGTSPTHPPTHPPSHFMDEWLSSSHPPLLIKQRLISPTHPPTHPPIQSITLPFPIVQEERGTSPPNLSLCSTHPCQ